MRTIIGIILCGTFSSAAIAQTITHYKGPNGEDCTKVEDTNHNVATSCGGGTATAGGTQPTSAPTQQGMNQPPWPPTPGTATANPPQGGMAPPWAQPNQPQVGQNPPSPDLASALVGRWQYRIMINNNAAEVWIAFDGTNYQEWMRFPDPAEQQRLGNQVLTESGHYQVSDNTLTTQPTSVGVLNGHYPNQICDLQSQRCVPLQLTPTQVTLQLMDHDTIQAQINGSTVTAKRIPQ